MNMRLIIIALILLSSNIHMMAQTQNVNVTVSPADATVILNGKIIKLVDGKAVIALPPEIMYQYSAAAEGYEGVEGAFRLKSASPFNLNIELTAEPSAVADMPVPTKEADAMEYARIQYENENYELAFKTFSQYPENPEAIYYMGMCHSYGLGMKKDFDKGYAMILQSAESGNAKAMNRIGSFYDNGLVHAKKRYEEAAKWYRKAAEHGYAYGKYNLAILQKFGDIKRDENEVVRLIQECMDEIPDAMAIYGELVSLGYGKLKKNYKEAVEWYRKSIDKGSVAGLFYLGKAYYYGYGVQSNTMEAYEWFKKGAAQGNSSCKNFIATHYKL